MSSSYRVRRRGGVLAETSPSSGSDLIDGPFRAWQAACAELRAAEQAHVEPDTILALATEVIRVRNTLTRGQIAAGWGPGPGVLDDLERDEQLVRESDARHL
jgi:hypothetical protein